MASQNRFQTLAVTGVVVLSLALFLGAGSARAQSNSAIYAFLVGAGFLCDTGDSSACPAVANSVDGDSYEMSGAGVITTQDKSVTAAGTYTHKSREGTMLETGVWTASELVGFDSYGIAPGALTREGRALDSPHFGLLHSRMFSGSLPSGGLAVFRIRLLPVRGLAKNATLQVNCAIGKVPPEHQVEGIRLAVEGGSVEFDDEISGRILFLLTRPGASAALKVPAPETETNPALAEAQK